MKSKNTLPYIRDVYPLRAQYVPGDRVEIILELHNPAAVSVDAEVSVDVFWIEKASSRFQETFVLKARRSCIKTITVDACAEKTGGFGVDVQLCAGGVAVSSLSTAYDVVRRWSDAPRYGFLSGFGKADEGDRADVDQLRKYHISLVQFYDWMYRHHELLPPEENFIDPMGRALSLRAVRGKIALCHEYGMRAMGYGASYTASREFAAQHPDMQFYRSDGEPELFGGGWVNIMNIAEGSEWVGHITGEFTRAVQELGLDGIHLDTYGFPKTAYSKPDSSGRLVRLDEEYPRFINRVKDELDRARPGAGVIFNAVGDWPSEEVALSRQDAVYIEVWPPCERYIHLHGIIARARKAGNKPVILAAYITAFKAKPAAAENALLLVSAVIFASGAYHIELGENNGVLADPYFVDHAVIRKTFEPRLRGYYDFIVRYHDLLYNPALRDVSMTHAGGINEEYAFAGAEFSSCGEPGKIWTIVKEMPGAKVIHFINFTGIGNDRWNEGKPTPRPVEGLSACVLDNERALGVYTASPDEGCRLTRLDFSISEGQRGRSIQFLLPRLDFWRMVYIKNEY